MKISIITILAIIPVFLSCNRKMPDENPNILFLLADDMGYGELGCYGQEVIQTPNIDSLAKSGMLFTNFYAGNAVCSPSRAVLMTGKHAGHATIRGNQGVLVNGVWDRIPLGKDEITLGEMMRQAGYQTAHIGKWHLDEPNDTTTWAKSRGFDYAIQEQWPSPYRGRSFNVLMHYINISEDSVLYNPEEYECIDEFRTNFAIDYLDKIDSSKPFFLFMSYRIPHGHEYYIRDTTMYAEYNWPEPERRHAAKITLLDMQIGRLLKRLEEDGELDNTVIFLTSDNGAHHEGNHDHGFFNSTGGLRGFKRDLYEGGIRVPFIASWNNKIKAGTRSDHISAFYDIMPTLRELAGVPAAENTDGISILPELTDKKQKKHEYLYWELQLAGWEVGGFRQAVRMDEWKGVRYEVNQATELYNLKSDPFELQNVADEQPEITEKINRLFETARIDSERFPYGGKSQP